MKELDLLFESFLRQDFDDLDEGQLQALDSLLLEPDQDILAWLSGSRPVPAEFEHIVETIKSGMA